MRKKPRFLLKNRSKIKFVLFFVYCIFIIYYAVLSRNFGDEHTADLRLMWAYREMLNGHPEWKEDVGYNLKNILFFIPFGVLFPEVSNMILLRWFKNKRWILILFIGMLFSLFIEIIQYVFCLGLCELDDVLCNGLGALIGCWLYEVISKSMLAEKHFKGWKE